MLLIAPAPTDIGRYGEEEALYDREVQALGPVYRQIAEKYGLRFADASGWEIPLAHDGVHFTGEGHRRFAREAWHMRTCQKSLWNILDNRGTETDKKTDEKLTENV